MCEKINKVLLADADDSETKTKIKYRKENELANQRQINYGPGQAGKNIETA